MGVTIVDFGAKGASGGNCTTSRADGTLPCGAIQFISVRLTTNDVTTLTSASTISFGCIPTLPRRESPTQILMHPGPNAQRYG